MIRSHTVPSLWTLLLLFGAFPAVSEAADRLRVEARWAGTGRPETIEFRVTNVTDSPIAIDESSFPWGRPNSVLLLADAEGLEPLKRVYPLSDVFRTVVKTIGAGETISGSVDMRQHLQDVSKALKTERVIVFWHYAPTDHSNSSLGEYGGWLTIKPKR